MHAHNLAQLEIAYAAFQAHGLKATTRRDRDWIEAYINDFRNNTFELSDADAVHAFISERTKIAHRVAFEPASVDVPPAVESDSVDVTVELPADAPVLYFEQDGAYFSYRDRPFYYVDFDYVGPDGMSAGVCPSFCTVAPFPVRDFNMPGAERAAAWFAQEAAKAGFRAERAPDYHHTTTPVPCHPDEELADIAFARDPERDLTSIAEFVAYRATPQEPVKREMFDTFETWRPAYLRLLHDWFSARDLEGRDLHEEEHYTAGLTPVAAANVECAAICA